jgi:phenol hydroxylase P5 protein
MTYQLTIEPLGETVAVEESQTVLDACLRSGIYLPYACGHGLCGTCKVNVIDGEVDLGDASPFALLDFERAEGNALACCARLRSDATIEADVDEEPDALRYPICDLTGTVTEITRPTSDIAILSIALPEPGLQFQAGQYVNVTIPGCSGPRAFSIASAPSQPTQIELHVRRVPGGAGTGYIHDTLVVGDRLSLSGPFGRFYVRRSANAPLVFIAGGSGLSSPKSMVLDLLETGYTAPIVLLHGVRTIEDLYFHDVFTYLAAQRANFTYVPALSQHDGSTSWTGALGFVHDVAAAHFSGSFKGWNAYLCGPPPMIEASIRALMKGRLFERDIYTERFVTARDGDAALARSPLFKRI